MLLHQIRKLVQKPAALRSRSIEAPCGLVGLFGSLDSEIDIFGCTFRNFGDDLAVGFKK